MKKFNELIESTYSNMCESDVKLTDKQVIELNKKILQYAKDLKMMEFDYIFKSVKRGYTTKFKQSIVSGTWYEMGKSPGVDGPEHVNNLYTLERNTLRNSAWIVAHDSYFFEETTGMRPTMKAMELWVYIDTYNGKVSLSWNSEGNVPKVKKNIKDKVLFAEIMDVYNKIES